MNDDRPHADRLHEDDVDQQGAERLGIFHDRAASLMTVNFPWNLRMKPIASINTSALRMASSCTASPPRVPDPSRVASKPSIFLCDRRL